MNSSKRTIPKKSHCCMHYNARTINTGNKYFDRTINFEILLIISRKVRSSYFRPTLPKLLTLTPLYERNISKQPGNIKAVFLSFLISLSHLIFYSFKLTSPFSIPKLFHDIFLFKSLLNHKIVSS